MVNRKLCTTRLSSITDTAARKFLNDTSNGDSKELACSKIPGFHLCKRINKTRITGRWRFRYTNASGKVRKLTIGQYPSLTPAAAAEQAVEHRTNVNNGIDPLQVVAERKEQQRQLEQLELSKIFRTVQQYLDGPYTEHQSSKIEGGRHTLSMIRSGFPDLLERDMESLSKADIFAWQQGKYSAGQAHSTVVRAYGALKTMLRHAVTHEYLNANPIASVQLLSPPDKEQERIIDGDTAERRRMLTDEELQGIHRGLRLYSENQRQKRRNSRGHGKAYLDELDSVPYPHWSIPFTILAMHTGLRPGDIRTLTWQELNLAFKRLTKTPRKTRHHPDCSGLMIPDTNLRW